MKTPKVSVLIPTYNYGNLINEAIDSVLAQTFTDYELIIVDNASTDNTEVVVEKYLHDPRIRYIKNDTNLGLAGNWNKCLDVATGKYIKFLCADDKFKPEILERFVAIMEEHTTVSIVACYRQVFGDTSKILTMPVQHYQSSEEMIYNTINSWNRLGEPTSTMFRRADISRVGKFNPSKNQFLDLDLWVRLLTIGDCYIIPETLSYLRSHQQQISWTNYQSNRTTFEEYEFYKGLLEGKGFTIDVSNTNIKSVIKGRAAICAKVMYKMLPKLHKGESRKVFKKAFVIALHEGVLFTPLIAYIRRSLMVVEQT